MGGNCQWCVIPASTLKDRRDCENVSFHRFPHNNNHLRGQWVKLVRTLKQDSSWGPREGTMICSRHFTCTQVQQYGYRRKLIGSPVPSLFLVRDDATTKEVEPTVPPPTPPLLPALRNQYYRSDTTGCFLCSILTPSPIPQSDHVKAQIHLFKDLLNQVAFQQGFLADASSSLVYPSEGGEKSCPTCLTTVTAVWALYREIIVLKERIKKIVEKSLLEHVDKFMNREKTDNKKGHKRTKQVENKTVGKRTKQIDRHISPKREKVEDCQDESVVNWMIMASTPSSEYHDAVSSSSTPDTLDPTEINCAAESDPPGSSSNSYDEKPVLDEGSSIISTPKIFPYSNEHHDTHAKNEATDETTASTLVKIEGDDNLFEFEEVEEMPTTSSTLNFTTPIITSTWVIRHMNTCKGVKL